MANKKKNHSHKPANEKKQKPVSAKTSTSAFSPVTYWGLATLLLLCSFPPFRNQVSGLAGAEPKERTPPQQLRWRQPTSPIHQRQQSSSEKDNFPRQLYLLCYHRTLNSPQSTTRYLSAVHFGYPYVVQPACGERWKTYLNYHHPSPA